MKIGELARLSGVPVRTLRFYDGLGLVISAGRAEGGYRLYGPEADNRLRLPALHLRPQRLAHRAGSWTVEFGPARGQSARLSRLAHVKATFRPLKVTTRTAAGRAGV